MDVKRTCVLHGRSKNAQTGGGCHRADTQLCATTNSVTHGAVHPQHSRDRPALPGSCSHWPGRLRFNFRLWQTVGHVAYGSLETAAVLMLTVPLVCGRRVVICRPAATAESSRTEKRTPKTNRSASPKHTPNGKRAARTVEEVNARAQKLILKQVNHQPKVPRWGSSYHPGL
jgi:hypothetical protein